MQVYEILNTDIEPLRIADAAVEALEVMKKHKIASLPVVDHTTNKLLGIIEKKQVEKNLDDLSGSLVANNLKPVTIDPDAHLFDAAKLMFESNVTVLPVVDSKKNFLGVIKRSDLLLAISRTLNVDEFGTVITIELGRRDFMLSELVRIIENESAKILGITVEVPDENNAGFRISLKLNLLDISRVTAALNRYGYTIIQETEHESTDEEFEERADEFLRYLDI